MWATFEEPQWGEEVVGFLPASHRVPPADITRGSQQSPPEPGWVLIRVGIQGETYLPALDQMTSKDPSFPVGDSAQFLISECRIY